MTDVRCCFIQHLLRSIFVSILFSQTQYQAQDWSVRGAVSKPLLIPPPLRSPNQREIVVISRRIRDLAKHAVAVRVRSWSVTAVGLNAIRVGEISCRSRIFDS